MSSDRISYSPELADEICALLADGYSLRSVCNREGMPTRQSVFNWLRSHPDFEKNYLRAKEECADMYAEEVVEIADDASNDWMARNDPDNPGWAANHDHIQRSRLRVDTRKWIASKLKPKRYGERLQHTGVEGEAPIAINASVTFVEAKKPE